jgi:hypothetical protein
MRFLPLVILGLADTASTREIPHSRHVVSSGNTRRSGALDGETGNLDGSKRLSFLQRRKTVDQGFDPFQEPLPTWHQFLPSVLSITNFRLWMIRNR